MSERASRAADSNPGAAIAAIWARHRDEALGRVTVLEDAVAALLENRLSEEVRRTAEREAHRLAGSAGTFGFLRASEAARQLEWILAGSGPVLPAGMLRAADQVLALRAAFDAGPSPAPVDPGSPADAGSPITAPQYPPGLGEGLLPRARRARRARATGTTVLVVVDSDPAVLASASAVLAPAGLQVAGLEDPSRFWAALEEEQPDLVILDLDMAPVSGEELCREVRSDARWGELPVLFLTGRTDPATIGAVFAAGADDFVARPFSGPELLARVQNRLERARLFRALVETDPVSGLTNRRRAVPDLQLLLGLAERHSRPFSIAMLGLDGFKHLNDQHGHAMGDTVLRHIGSLLRQSFRREDVVARWDGDQFLLGMHGMAHDDGVQIIAYLLEALREERFITPSGPPISVTFSAGIATYPGDATTVQGLCEAASQAMYRTKRTGRDRELPAAPPAGTHNVDVVVVEDDSALAELLEHAITTRGYRFHHLADGRAAVDQLAGPAPALRARVLLLDVDLPVINGFGVLRQMANAGTLAGTRVIMLTARSSEREVIEALELGAFDHVAKPFNVPVLMQRIRQALGT